jgi:hypothetical protein
MIGLRSDLNGATAMSRGLVQVTKASHPMTGFWGTDRNSKRFILTKLQVLATLQHRTMELLLSPLLNLLLLN